MEASMNKSGERYVLAIERRLSHPPAKVWRVCTEPELMNQWFPAHVIGEWTVGAELRFEFQHGEGEGLSEDDMRGQVLTVEPEKLLEFTWGQHVMRCELIPDGNGCRFLFSDTFDDASTAARSGAGWEFCLQNLDMVLEGVAVAKFAWEAWRGRYEHYVKVFQPEYGPQQGAPSQQKD